MLAFLLSLISGPILTGLLSAYREKLAAGNTRDAKAVELAIAEIQAEIIARVEANKLLIVEQGHWYTACIRPLLALPIVIYYWKIIVWDKVLGWGSTDPILGAGADWAGWIIMAYMGGVSAERISKIFANR